MSLDMWNDVARSLNRSRADLDPSKGFVENGGHSLAAISLSRLLKRKGMQITVESLLICDCLTELLGEAPSLPSTPIETPKSSLQSITTSSQHSEELDLAMQHNNVPKFRDVDYNKPRDGLIRAQSFMPTRPPSSASRLPHHRAGPTTHGGDASLRSPSLSFTDLRNLSRAPQNEHQTGHDSDWPKLTEMQLSLLHGSLKSPGSNIIHHSETYFSEYLPVLRLAWKRIMEVEPVFKTQFPHELVGRDQITFEWIELVASSREHYDDLIRDAFDDSRIGSHFCVVTLMEPGARSVSTIIWTVHHALIDGYSASLLFDKIRQFTTGVPISAGPSFSELATQLHHYQTEHREQGVQFWLSQTDQLASARGDLGVPDASASSSRDSSSVASEEIDIQLSKREFAALAAEARSNKVTLAAMLHAAWALVLSHYASSDLVVFGTVLASRNLPLRGILETIGPMVNTLPLCVAVDKTLRVQDYVRAVFKRMVRLSEFSWTTASEHGYSRNFESAVAMQFDTQADSDTYQSIQPIEKPKSKQTTSIPLSIAMDPDGCIHLQAHTHRVSSVQAQRIGQMLHDALLALCRPHATVGDCKQSLLTIPMLTELREKGNANSGLTTVPSITEDLVTLFEKAVKNAPEDVAVERGTEKLSYGQLDILASSLATHLETFVQPGDAICVNADRSLNWTIAICGILKAGAAYCALDPSLPDDLKSSMYGSANAKAFLATSTASIAASPKSCDRVIDLEAFLASGLTGDSTIRQARATPRPADLAYLCFTSGSTGVPKGVLCTHQGLVAFQRDLEVRLFARPGERIAQIMSPAFDGSIHEIFSALSYGATLVLPVEGSQMFDQLASATSCILTPSIARVLSPTDYPDLKSVYLVGEPVPPAVSDLWSSHVALYNMYGPTEGTCGATIKRLLPGQPVTIGKPNPTTRIYIMNEDRTLVPPGVIGEIFLAGVQIARGYIGLPEVTADRFTPDPICPIGEYMYKTGDRGYWNEDGEIVCLGRNDREVKLRGFRLDMNDLEVRVARAEPALQAVAVLVHNEQLMLVVQPASTDIAALKSKISRALAQHQRPSRIMALESLPTTRAGKTDYLALKKLLSQPETAREEDTTPASPTLRKVISTVRAVLQLQQDVRIRNDAGFDELGGTSLKQVALCSRLSKEFGVQVPLRLIIERPRLSAIAEAIDVMLSSGQYHRAGSCSTIDRQKASPGEREWFEKYQLDRGTSAFNVFYGATFSPSEVSRKRLKDAWNTVLLRHTILRSRYVKGSGNRVARLMSDCAPRAQAVSELSFWTEANRPFYVSKNDPIRVIIGQDTFMVVISHIIADFSALSVLLDEVSLVYSGRQLPPVVKTYDEADTWYKEAGMCYKTWWLEYLASLPQEPSLLKPEKKRKSYNGTSLVSQMPRSLYHDMRKLTSQAGVSMQQLALAAIALVLSCEDCEEDDKNEVDMLLGTPFLNRPTDDDLSVVGLYLEPLPVRVAYPTLTGKQGGMKCNEDEEDTETSRHQQEREQEINPDGSITSYLEAVHRSSQMALANAMPWHQLLEVMGSDAMYPSHPLFDVMVSFHDVSQTEKIGDVIPGVKACFAWSEGSKFKLMVEFSAYDEDVLMMRLEHDTEIFSTGEIFRLETMIPQALDMLAGNRGHLTIGDIRMALRDIEEGHRPPTASKEGEVFGKPITDL